MKASTQTLHKGDSPSSQFDVFVSYSRRDKAFIQKLVTRLKKEGYTPWVDWDDIPPLAQWRDEIRQGIVAADNFLYVISPDTICSSECEKELSCAIAHNKRLVPIVYRSVESKVVNSAIAEINWIFFCEAEQFEKSLAQLLQSLQTDLDYVRTHTRLLTKTDEWAYHQQDSSLLLRGASLDSFERWATQAIENHPSLTAQQRQYLFTSRQVEKNRQKQEIQKQRLVLGIISSLLALVVVLGIRVEIRRRTAIIGEMKALSAVSAATMAQGQPFESLFQAMKAGKLLQQAWWARKSEAFQTVQSALGNVTYRNQESNRLEGHRNWVYSLSISPDGENLASASFDGSIKLWTRSGQLITTIEAAHDGQQIWEVRYSPDGQLLASAGADNKVHLWTVSGELVRSFEKHSELVTSVSFSPDGQTLASSSKDDTVLLWNIDGSLKSKLVGHTGDVFQVVFSPDGNLLASASADSTVRLWKADGTLVESIERPPSEPNHLNGVWDLAFSPNGETLASVGHGNNISLWQRDGSYIKSFRAHDDHIKAIQFSPDGKFLASASSDRTVKLWRSTNQELVTTLLGHQDSLQALAFSPDSNTVLSTGRDKTIRMWNWDQPFFQQQRQHMGGVTSIDVHPNTGKWISSSYDGTVRIWQSRAATMSLKHAPNRQVYQAKASPDGQYIVAVGIDDETEIGFAELWTSQGEFVRTVASRPGGWVISATFDINSKLIASASDNGDINLWRLDGTLVHTLRYDAIPLHVIFSPDATQIAVTGNDGIKVWRTENYELLHSLDYPAGVIRASYSPDGSTLAFASRDNTVGLWSLGDDSSVKTLEGHQSSVNSVQFSPDGTQLASASKDKTIRLWRPSGELIVELSGHTDGVNDVSFTQDGTTLLSVSDDNTLIEWDLSILDLDSLMAIGCEQIQDYLETNPSLQPADQKLCH